MDKPKHQKLSLSKPVEFRKESISSSTGYSHDNDFLPEDNISENRPNEVALWRAVITQALMDAGSASQKREMKYDRAQAIAWLSGTSADFHIVCSMADMEPDYVRRKAKEAIERGCVWRQAPGFKKKQKPKKAISVRQLNQRKPTRKKTNNSKDLAQKSIDNLERNIRPSAPANNYSTANIYYVQA